MNITSIFSIALATISLSLSASQPTLHQKRSAPKTTVAKEIAQSQPHIHHKQEERFEDSNYCCLCLKLLPKAIGWGAVLLVTLPFNSLKESSTTQVNRNH